MAGLTIWTKSYWLSVLERVIRGAAIGALLYIGVPVVTTGQLNALDVDWSELFGFTLGGAVLALLLSIAGNIFSKNGPAFVNSERVKPELPAPPES